MLQPMQTDAFKYKISAKEDVTTLPGKNTSANDHQGYKPHYLYHLKLYLNYRNYHPLGGEKYSRKINLGSVIGLSHY